MTIIGAGIGGAATDAAVWFSMVRIIAHRGASLTHVENTIEAFEAARDQGADGVELDVRRAGGEVLVVHHDANLADGRRLLDLEDDDRPGWMPTLGQALDACSGMLVNVEIKNVPDDPDYDEANSISLAVAGLLTAHILGEPGSELDNQAELFARRVLVSSFNATSLDRMIEINPAIPTALLVWGQAAPVSLVQRAVAHGVQAIHPHDVLVDRSFVTRAHEAGLAVNVWTVDDPDRMVQLADFGVDGIITNSPAVAARALR